MVCFDDKTSHEVLLYVFNYLLFIIFAFEDNIRGHLEHLFMA